MSHTHTHTHTILSFWQSSSKRGVPAFHHNGQYTYWRLLVRLSVPVPGELKATDQSIRRLINLSSSTAASTGCVFPSQCPDALFSGELWLVSVVSRPKLLWEEIGTNCRGRSLGSALPNITHTGKTGVPQDPVSWMDSQILNKMLFNCCLRVTKMFSEFGLH